jgi:hypothetical protein
MRWKGLYQRILYALPKVALQGSIATLIYVLVTHTNNRCKVATHNGVYGNAYMCLYNPWANYFYVLLQHKDLVCRNTYMHCKE